jgi:outer membrane protein assembly factor BamB
VVASDWTTFDQNSQRTGVDASGDSFSPASPAWSSPVLDGQLYGQALVAAGRVYAATENDTVDALAADSGAVLWSDHLAAPVEAANLPCGDISPTVGITSTPVIDSARSEIFVVADEAASPIASHHLIGLNLYTGAVMLDEAIDPPGTDPAAHLQRASLALDDGSVIIGFGGNADDCSDYHGLVVSAPEDGSTPTTYVVADQPGDSQGAVWMGGAAPTVDAQGNIWLATGNSEFHSSSDTYDQSDSVLELNPSMQLVDDFAPQTWYADNSSDLDLGSTTPALLPNGLVFEVGKSQTAYVLDQSHLGGVGGQVALKSSFCFADGGAADLDGTLFVPCSGGVEAVTPTANPPTATWSTSSGAHGSPIVAGGLVWSIGNGNLYALNAATGTAVQHFTIGASSSSFPSPSAADGLVLAPSSTQVHAFDGPGGPPGPPSAPPAPPATIPPAAYYLAAADGGIFSFGGSPFYGSTGALSLNKPVVGVATTLDRRGYWLVASDGGIFNFGDAGFFGSTGALHLNRPVVGMAPAPGGQGYWLVASDGGVFALGDAGFFGSTGSLRLNQPVVGMASTPDGQGYWLVASDGGVFAFGDAAYEGSTGSLHLNQPIVGMAATPDGHGYWLVAADGGVFAFGDAAYEGSTGSLRLAKPIVGMAATPDGGGYWLVASDGGVFAFGDAAYGGSTGGVALNRPIVGMAPGLPST